MSRSTAFVLCLVAIVLMATGCQTMRRMCPFSCCDAYKPGGAEEIAAARATIAQKTCPVMTGREISPKLFSDYEGRRIYFCCSACKVPFKLSPRKYIARVDAEIKAQGVE